MSKWKATVEALIGLGWTQDELASECGCTQSTISSIYQGHTKSPRADLALKLMALRDAGMQADPPKADAVASAVNPG